MLPPGTLLKLIKEITRVRGTMAGIALRGTDDGLRIETPSMVAWYGTEEITYLLREARTWPVGGDLDTLLP